MDISVQLGVVRLPLSIVPKNKYFIFLLGYVLIMFKRLCGLSLFYYGLLSLKYLNFFYLCLRKIFKILKFFYINNIYFIYEYL